MRQTGINPETYLLEKTLPEDIHLHRKYPDIREAGRVSVAAGMIHPPWEPSNVAPQVRFPWKPEHGGEAGKRAGIRDPRGSQKQGSGSFPPRPWSPEAPNLVTRQKGAPRPLPVCVLPHSGVPHPAWPCCSVAGALSRLSRRLRFRFHSPSPGPPPSTPPHFFGSGSWRAAARRR